MNDYAAATIADGVEVRLQGVDLPVYVREIVWADYAALKDSPAREAALVAQCCEDAHGNKIWSVDDIKMMPARHFRRLIEAINELSGLDNDHIVEAQKK